jgi:ketosteroid isomerase-like protein
VTASRVELLRRIYADWARGDFSAGWDRLADDVQFIPLDDITDPDRTRGPEAIRGFLDDLTESFSDLTIEGRGSGASSEYEYWMQWVFDESDRVVCFGALRDE